MKDDFWNRGSTPIKQKKTKEKLARPALSENPPIRLKISKLGDSHVIISQKKINLEQLPNAPNLSEEV